MTQNVYQGVLPLDFGNCRKTERVSSCENKKLHTDNIHLSKGMKLTQVYELPIVAPYNGYIPDRLIPFCDRKNHQGFVHFYIDDYKFARVWNKAEFYTEIFKKEHRSLIAPDFSQYADQSRALNINNLYRNRLLTAYWQMQGLHVIPSASWGNAESFEYCFEGLPQNSVIFIGGVGIRHDKACIKLWRHGIIELERQLHPTMILIYGNEVEPPQIETPTKCYNSFLTKLRGGAKWAA